MTRAHAAMSAAGPPRGANSPCRPRRCETQRLLVPSMPAQAGMEPRHSAPLYADDSHRSGCAMMGVGIGLRGPAQPVAPLSSELVPKHVGVQVLAFVAKPEQLPECTSYMARMGYDKR